MATNRRIEALRALAERPGTEHEGHLAREILERLQSKYYGDAQGETFRAFLRREVSLEYLLAKLKDTPPTSEEQMFVDEQEKARKRREMYAEAKRKFKFGDRITYRGKSGSVSETGLNFFSVKFDGRMWPEGIIPCIDGEWTVEMDTNGGNQPDAD